MNGTIEDRVFFETKSQFYSRVDIERNRFNLDNEPFRINGNMIDATWNAVEGYPAGTSFRAIAVYNWVSENFKWDTRDFNQGYLYSTASETFKNRKGKCSDFGFLYTSMARVAGLDSRYVLVREAFNGDKTAHACSGVYVKDYSGLVLVDMMVPAWDVKHRSFDPLSDNQVFDLYRDYCLNFNKGDISALSQAAHRFGVDITCAPETIRFTSSHNSNFLRYVAFIALLSTGIFGLKHLSSDFLDGLEIKLHKVVHKPITEESIKSDREKRFEDMLEYVQAKYPGDERFKDIWYTPENYNTIMRIKIDEIKNRIK